MTLPGGLTPSKVVAVHLNYRSRAEQRGRVPDVPSYFLKPPSSLSADGAPVVRPRGTELLAFEGEVALVIGKRAKRVHPDDALAHVGWVTIANDFGLYDLRWADRGSNLLSKGQDGFTPIGPRCVPAADLDLTNLDIETRVDGEVVQRDSTANLLFSFGDLVADLSRLVTLEPGDLILTGTPAGSRPVQAGSTVEVEVSRIGTLRNTVAEAEHALEPWGAQPKVDGRVRATALGVDAPRPVTLTDAAWAALQQVSTATLTVQLTRRGIRNAFIAGLRSTRPDLRLLGYASTLRYVALREDVRDADTAPLNQQKQAVESIAPDEVLVMEARDDAGAGTIGDILAARVLARGGTGIVTDGGLRDRDAVGALDIPTYYQAPHAAVLGLIHYPLERHVPITCGGALVMPGDVLVGDGDGVVVLPAAMAEAIAHDSLAQEQREAWALERVRAGDSIRGVYPLGDARRAEYEAWLAAREGGAAGTPATPDEQELPT
jgi:2-keto-4-pentenoate hydratase/2-oxohepta-3-ene-1,7-dioic acid hydratase in catechol pathway/regulator of RNase E activity RraA